MTFLLRNWRYVFIILSALALAGFGFYIRSIMAENASLKVENAQLDEQIKIAALEINQCVSDKVLTEKVSNDYQKSIHSLRFQLNGLRDSPACVPTTPTAPSDGHNGSPAGGIVSGSNGIRTGYLLDFAGDAEETRLKLLGCQAFINNLYKSRGLNK